jgi:bifunctional DNase/RNase
MVHMIAMSINRILVSLVSHHRVVLLKEDGAERYLAIWIGPCEAEATSLALQKVTPPRPQTHDLLKNLTEALGATVSQVLVSELKDNTFHARIVMDIDGRHVEVDSRPSDAMALAVRCAVPILVAEQVMDEAGIVPSPELEPVSPEEEERLSAYRELLESLDKKASDEDS